MENLPKTGGSAGIQVVFAVVSVNLDTMTLRLPRLATHSKLISEEVLKLAIHRTKIARMVRGELSLSHYVVAALASGVLVVQGFGHGLNG